MTEGAPQFSPAEISNRLSKKERRAALKQLLSDINNRLPVIFHPAKPNLVLGCSSWIIWNDEPTPIELPALKKLIAQGKVTACSVGFGTSYSVSKDWLQEIGFETKVQWGWARHSDVPDQPPITE